MAPTIIPRSPSGEHVRHITRTLSSAFSKLSIRDAASSSTSLASVFALIIKSRSSVSRRALTSIAELSSRDPQSSTILTDDLSLLHSDLYKRQTGNQNYILAIPATYKNLNSGPAPGAVVGITLGAVFGFILCLYILLLSFQTWGGGSTTVIKEEVIVDKRRSHSRKSRKSSHHTSVHEPSPPAPPRSRRETIVEIEEEIIRHSSHHSPPPPPHSEHSLEEVIVAEAESSTEVTRSEEMVVVVEEEEEQSSLASPSPPPRKPSSRRSGFRTVDPAEFGGGRASMTRISRRSSARSPGS